MSDLGVCLMGVGIVFAGLVCLVALCKIMGLIIGAFVGKKAKKTEEIVETKPSTDVIPNREEMVAAISAVVAEELGKDISAIRIVSLKRI